MEIYTAMVAKIDMETGRVIQTLKDTGRYNNTIVLFLSDNGANNPASRSYSGEQSYWHRVDNRLENMGRKNSFVSLGKNWADVSNAPYAFYHKSTSGQGGIQYQFYHCGS